ncbi:MAG: hypothetical protein JNK85_21745 [Verrucomicrobiales bacterium]|nr:hypothetical protein [Verrucomicrobiales bacterium]
MADREFRDSSPRAGASQLAPSDTGSTGIARTPSASGKIAFTEVQQHAFVDHAASLGEFG